MQYRDFCQERVSVLGYGCMRFPTADGKIDEAKALPLLERAFERGVNYYDTAYPYHDGESESFLGRCFVKKHRSDIFLATKSPIWLLKTEEDFERIFNEQLSKLGTDYIDFYLLHALDAEGWDKVKQLKVIDNLKKLKAEGKIRHAGFSFHDSFDVFREIVDYWDEWEFCQIQLNYINVDHQAGLAGLEYANQKGLGVIIMEPLLGGRLASPPPQVRRVLGGDKTPVEYSLNFLWNRPEVGLLLSGMGAMEQVEENVALADKSRVGMMSEQELNMLAEAKRVFDNHAFVACTACGYCMPCPSGLDIPEIYKLYNRTAWSGKKAAKEEYLKLSVNAEACVGCEACVRHCPQNIQTPAMMQEIVKAFAD